MNMRGREDKRDGGGEEGRERGRGRGRLREREREERIVGGIQIEN